jgi:hypothetical protein
LAIVMPPSVCNAAGEWEPERRSRRANLIDGLGTAALVLVILWPFGFGWGVLERAKFVHPACEWILRFAIGWAIFGSPLWHGDTLQTRGLGGPIRFWRLVAERRGRQRWSLVILAAAIFECIFTLSVAHWPQTARFLLLPASTRVWPDGTFHWIEMGIFCAVVSAFIATGMVRYDNLGPAFTLAVQIAGALLVYAALGAVWHQGAEAFESLGSSRYAVDAGGYVIWGLLQQLIFTAFFSTRLRKGFGPSRSPSNIVPREDRPRKIRFGGLVAAGVGAPLIWFVLRTAYDQQAPNGFLVPFAFQAHPAGVAWIQSHCLQYIYGNLIPIGFLVPFAILAYPAGAVWTHYYCRDKRRMLVATLSGSIFGAIHVSSYGLVALTTGLGTIFAYIAMEDRYRNLAACGLVHGLLGSAFSTMFKYAGVLCISFRVGPWNVTEFSAMVLVVPMLYVGAYALLAFWSAHPRRPWNRLEQLTEADLATETV